MNEEPGMLMSLNDTLTCGLGACVLLFIVFVILVTLDDPERPAPRPQQSGLEFRLGPGPRPTEALDPLWIRVRGPCRVVRSVEASGYPDLPPLRLLRDRRGTEDACVALVRHPEPPRNRALVVRGNPNVRGTLFVTALIGGHTLVDAARVSWGRRTRLEGAVDDDEREPIVSIDPRRPKTPVAWGRFSDVDDT